jgi:hypothetical protein
LNEATPAGWYTDPNGRLRWWDGVQWGMEAPRPADTSSKPLAIFCHLGVFIGGFILPLVVYLTEGKKNDFVRHHAAEALNFNITYFVAMLAWMGCLFGSIVVGAGTSQSGSAAGPGALFFLIFGLFFVIYLAVLGMAIVGAIKAGKDEWWRYPVNIRLVKGARQ